LLKNFKIFKTFIEIKNIITKILTLKMKNIRGFFRYLKIIKQNKEILWKEFKLRKDYIGRLYTVINITKEIEDNIKKYGISYIDIEIKKYVKNLDLFTLKVGLSELISISHSEILDKFNILLILEYRFLNVKKIVTRLLWSLVIITLLTILLLIFI